MSLLIRRRMMMVSDWHPLYKVILARAVAAGLNLPTYQCMKLQNTLVANLAANGLWIWDYLHIFANNSGDAEFGKINWAQPSLSLGSGSPGYVIKKGIYQSYTLGFDWATNVINQNTSDSAQIIYITIDGTNPGATEVLYGATGANLRLQMIRMQTNGFPNVIHNATAAGNTAIHSVVIGDNAFFEIGHGNPGGGIHFTGYKNGVLVRDDFPSASGTLPNTTSPTINCISSRQIGIVGSGRSPYGLGKSALLNTFVSQYMTAVQALP